MAEILHAGCLTQAQVLANLVEAHSFPRTRSGRNTLCLLYLKHVAIFFFYFFSSAVRSRILKQNSEIC